MGIFTNFNPAHHAGNSLGILDRLQTRIGTRHMATGFVSQPEPRTVGSYARGKQLLAGNFRLGSHLIEAPGLSLWDIEAPTPGFEKAAHSFVWLDDLAAIGDAEARRRAQDWILRWIDLFGAGRGPGWSLDLTGRRIIRWINHAVFVLNGMETEQSKSFFRCLSSQSAILSKRWSTASRGLPRFEALTGLIYAGIALEGMEQLLEPAIDAMSRECADQIDGGGGLPTRNPEELTEVLTLLTWTEGVLREHGLDVPSSIRDAIDRIVPTLRTLRHADGSLARFHGGGRGEDGLLDQSLLRANVKPAAPQELAMGFARLSCARTTVIADVAAPPASAASENAHASTLAFELTSGRRPLIVNCGPGTTFGPDWRRAGRATQSHSTLAIDGVSSAKIANQNGADILIKAPKRVASQLISDNQSNGFLATHSGYVPEFGLTHMRKLTLGFDGRTLTGEDTLAAVSDPDRILFEKFMDANALAGVGYSLRFHIHPEVEPEINMGGHAVSLRLKSGEMWVFRFGHTGKLSLEPSLYLEKSRLKPRATQQIVLSAHMMEYASQVSWSLTKAQEPELGSADAEEALQLALDE